LERLKAIPDDRRFQMLVDAVSDHAIFMVDPDGVVASWNSGAERITGYSADAAIGRHLSTFFTQEDRRRALPERGLEAALARGRLESDGWRLRQDGGRFWAQTALETIRDEDGEAIGFVATIRDITERRAAQEALLESERQFRVFVEGVNDCALIMLDPNGVITSWNPGAQRIKGYAADEIIGQHFSRFYTDADRRSALPVRALNHALGEGKYEAEGWRVRKDGSTFWASVLIDPIRDAQGQLIGFAKITRDITDRRQAQLELQRTQEQLVQSQKMEALGQLTGGVAHDFNNLLMVVSGHADLLRRRADDNPQLAKSLEAILQAVRRGESLTRQLLSFARRQRLDPRSVNLAEHFENFHQMLASSMKGNVRLSVLMPEDLWSVLVDPNELELALVNIAVNARDAMPDGGPLTFMAENRTLAPGDVGPDLEGEFVALAATDGGGGIPPDVLPKVFDPFFSTKPAGKGTGLGLSQVYGFARQSGGTVEITSTVGEGSTITLYLPRAATAGGPVEAAAASPDPAQEPSGARVLLVEDNPEVAQVTAAMLDLLGYQVQVEGAAAPALERLDRGEVFDLVFSDIVMAGAIDGLGLAKAVRQRYPGLPVLLATGYTSAAEAAHGDFTILRKPYQMAELGRAVASRLEQVGAENGDASNLVRFPQRRSSKSRKD
jgi:PAS domain S-box-containing protein